jgi:hypothetical protein
MHIHDNVRASAFDLPSATPPFIYQICDGEPEASQNAKQSGSKPNICA